MNGRWARRFVGSSALSLLLLTAYCLLPAVVMAAEHGGKEHGGKEHSGTTTPAAAAQPAMTQPAATPSAAPATAGAPAIAQTAKAEPSAEQIRQAIRDYVSDIEREEGSFTIEDEVTGKVRTLALVRVHDRVGKTGAYYYSCTDMKDTETGDLLDLDFDVESAEGELNVVDVRIHKVNGQARYTYDDKDNRIPLM